MSTAVTTSNTEPTSSPLDGFVNAVNASLKINQENQEQVGRVAGEIISKDGEALVEACNSALEEVQTMEIQGPNPDEVKAEIREAILSVLEAQRNAPAEIVRELVSVSQQVQDIRRRAISVRVGRQMLPLVKAACGGISQEDVQAADECAEILETFSRLVAHRTDEVRLPASTNNRVYVRDGRRFIPVQ